MQKNQNERKDEKKNAWRLLLVFFILSFISIVMATACLINVQAAWIQAYLWLWIMLVSTLIIAFYLFCIWWVVQNKSVMIKTSISIYLILVFCLSSAYFLQKTGFFVVFKDAEKLQEYLQKAGIWMPLFYILLQFLQVVILPIPSIVSTVVGVALFGAFQAMLYSILGILLGSAAAFCIGKKFGYKAVAWMVGEETLQKWQKKLKGKDNLFLTLAFLLPLFPDDILCFLAGLSSMTWRYFLIMIFVTRTLGIAGTCYSIDFIPFNTWWGIVVWVCLLLSAMILICWIYRNLDNLQSKLSRKNKPKKEKRNHLKY